MGIEVDNIPTSLDPLYQEQVKDDLPTADTEDLHAGAL